MRALIAAACFACGAACAQAPTSTTAQATELAQRLGRERSAEGLETIIKSGNRELLAAYGRGLNNSSAPGVDERERGLVPMPANLEALMVRYFDDPAVGRQLPMLCATNVMRCRSPQLFEQMFTAWRSAKPGSDTYNLGNAVTRYEAPEALARLTEWLAAPDAPKGEDQARVIRALGKHQYAPAVPVLTALMLQAPPGKPSVALEAFYSIQTTAAAEALLARMEAIARVPSRPEIVAESKGLASRLSQYPPEVKLPYARVKALLPPDTRDYAIQWLGTRKDLAAASDVIVLLGEAATYPRAIEAVVASDSPQVWKDARAALDRYGREGKLQQNQLAYAIPLLDRKIADPERHALEGRVMQKQREYSAHYQLLARDLEEARKLRTGNPKAYVAAVREYIVAQEKLIADYPELEQTTRSTRSTVAGLYLDMGHVTRFRLKQPRDALELYARAQERGPGLGAIAIADTLQFDLRDTQRALAEYRKLVETVPAEFPEGDVNLSLKWWTQRWFAAQIEFLSTGKAFTGAIKPNDLAVAMMLANGFWPSGAFDMEPLMQALQRSGGNFDKVDRAEVERALKALPPSLFALQSSAMFVSFLPDARSILAHLARHDPAGYASATYFAFLDLADREGGAADTRMVAPGMRQGAGSDPLREAKARFLAEHRIDIKELREAARARSR